MVAALSRCAAAVLLVALSILTHPADAAEPAAGGLRTYPRSDCPFECTNKPAPGSLFTCSTPVQTRCVQQPDSVCPTRRYLDSFQPENYCMPRFAASCAHPDNIGCSRTCGLFVALAYHCITDAYSKMVGNDGVFNPNCTYCNMCMRGRAGPPNTPAYVLIRARGDTGGIFANHYLVMPRRACSGVESGAAGCTDETAEGLWGAAYAEATQRLNFTYSGGAPDWAILINPPNRRGVHQMHIHIAALDSTRSAPDIDRSQWLLRRLAATGALSTEAANPTFVVGEGYYEASSFNCSFGKGVPLKRPPRNWARVGAVFVPTNNPARALGTTIMPFALARAINAGLRLDWHSYGILIMPRRFGNTDGVIIGATYSTDDWEQLDQQELPGDPVGYSRTCNNYIGVPLPP